MVFKMKKFCNFERVVKRLGKTYAFKHVLMGFLCDFNIKKKL